MQRLLAKHRFLDTDRALRFLEIRLLSRPETATLAAEVNQARSRMREQEDAYQQALQARIAASAEIEYLDRCLDESVMNLSRELLALVRGDRKDARFLKLFSTPPSVGMAPLAGDTQDVYVRNIVQRLLEDSELASLRPRAEELAGQRQALQTAVEKRRSLAVPEASTNAERRLAIEHAQRVYNRSQAQLRLLLEDAALIESYFLDLSRTSSAASDAEQTEA